MPKQLRLADYFPVDGPERHTNRVGSGFSTHPENRSEDGSKPLDGISTKWRAILSLEMQGVPKNDIATRLGMAPASVSHITLDDRYIKYRDDYLAQLDSEFFAMKPLALQAMRQGLQSSDENVALRAADMWFSGARYQGYDKHSAPTDRNVTAEDVVKQLLQVNVQVNVENH